MSSPSRTIAEIAIDPPQVVSGLFGAANETIKLLARRLEVELCVRPHLRHRPGGQGKSYLAMDGISFCGFSDVDVVRHPLVQSILIAYERRDAALAPERGRSKPQRAASAPAPSNHESRDPPEPRP